MMMIPNKQPASNVNVLPSQAWMTTPHPGDRKSMECAANDPVTAMSCTRCLGEGLVASVRATLDAMNCVL